jgi:hypothetical protein
VHIIELAPINSVTSFKKCYIEKKEAKKEEEEEEEKHQATPRSHREWFGHPTMAFRVDPNHLQ